MDKVFKLILSIAALLVCAGVFYYLVIFLPEIERKKEERLERKQTHDTQKDIRNENRFDKGFISNERRHEQTRQDTINNQAAKQAAYQACKQSSDLNYQANWRQACTLQFQRAEQILISCVNSARQIHNNNELSRNREAACVSRFGGQAYSPQCPLPSAQAESMNRQRHAEQQRCLAEANQNLR